MAYAQHQEHRSKGKEVAPPPAAPSEPPPDLSRYTGPERAAILLLALGVEHGQSIWADLDDNELIAVSIAMSKLGNVPKAVVEALLTEFISQMSLAGAMIGTAQSTERLLAQYLPKDRLAIIMEEIRGPAGRNMWEKLSNVQAHVLASYLKNEYPQTVAVILSKIATEHAARVLSILPEDFALDVVQRMLRMGSVQREILEKIEHTLRNEFISNLSQTHQRDAHELMAEIFNNFDRQTESRFLTALEEINWEAAEQIKSLMFTFDDLTKLDRASAQTLLRNIDHEVLVLALKGASDTAREFFFSNMSERAGRMLKDDLEVLGPVRLREVDEAQAKMIARAKELAAKGDIVIAKNGGDDELIY